IYHFAFRAHRMHCPKIVDHYGEWLQSESHKSFLDSSSPALPRAHQSTSCALSLSTSPTMTSHIPTLKPHATPTRPVKGASLVAGSTQEDDQKTWMARLQGPFDEVIPPTTVQALPRKPVMSSEQHANHSVSSRLTLPVQKSRTILLPEYLVFRAAYTLPTAELVDEDGELCWPLSKETSGPPRA